MIKSITITNHLDESIEIILTEPDKSGFIVKSIDGLGPVNANVHILDLATIDGGIDNGARLGTRNIVLSLGFIGTPTIEDTRQKTYKYFPIKQTITFKIETDNRICYTTGRIESNTPNIFDKEEGCQISILCNDPYFYNVDDESVVLYSEEPNFEFPFENDSVVAGKNLLMAPNKSWITNGLTFTVDHLNNEVIVSGVATADTNIMIGTFPVIASGTYMLSGCPLKKTTNDYCLFISSSQLPTPYGTDNGSGGVRLSLTGNRTYSIWVRVYSGIELNATFTPFIKKYQETVEHNYIVSSDLTWVQDDAEFKIDKDGIVTVNGTLNEKMLLCVGQINDLLNDRSYILNGCPSNGSGTTYKLDIVDKNGAVKVSDTGNGVTFTKTDDTYSKVYLTIFPGIALSNKEFKPMVRYSSETDPSYEPYKSLYDEGPLLEMGILDFNVTAEILYTGDKETGISIEMHATGSITGLSIYNLDTDEVMRISDDRINEITGSGIKDGDTILINTRKGKKSIQLLRNGVYINILNSLIAPISWFVLRTGDNNFLFSADTGIENLKSSISYKDMYEGI